MPKNIDNIIRSSNPKPKLIKKSGISPIQIKPAKNNLKKNVARLIRHNKNKTKSLFSIFVVLLLIFIFLFIYSKPAIGLYSFKKDGKYLILLQNNAELRGGGGFLGSFAVVEIANNATKKYYFESNIYKKDNEYAKISTYPLPDYLAKHIGGKLGMRDSNYAADFSAAAQNVAKFYQLEYDEKVDGVIALNASAISDLLKITGPISGKNNSTTIDKDNFFDTLQSEIQRDYFKEEINRQLNEPKTILKEMVDPLIDKVKQVSPLTLLNYFKREISNKMITFWFDDDRQKTVEKNNWGGVIYSGKYESLFVSDTNVAGGKSSLAMIENIELIGENRKDRKRKLTIIRVHNGGTDYDSNHINRNYTRIYLPKGTNIGSIIVEGTQFTTTEYEVGDEFGKTWIGFWLNTEPKQTKTAMIEYQLPNNISSKKIIIQKQPGVVFENLKIQFGNKVLINKKMYSDLII